MTECKVWAESAHAGMGTEIIHKAFGINAEESLRDVAAESAKLEKMLSRFVPESEISAINRYAGIKRVNLSSEAYAVLSRAAEYSVLSRGLFDITVGSLVDLWDYKNASDVPDKANIRKILRLVNYRDLLLDPRDQTAELKKAGQSVDLGGVGKGYASDRFMEIFKENGITSAFSNIGGNVSTLGSKPDGSPWRVGIKNPRCINCLLGSVSVTGRSVVTSGDYERYFIDREGRRRHHILNPVTGYPAESGLISVTVIADSAMTADALSTSIFIAGIDRGIEILKKFPDTDAVLTDDKHRIFITRGLRECFMTTEVTETKLL